MNPIKRIHRLIRRYRPGTTQNLCLDLYLCAAAENLICDDDLAVIHDCIHAQFGQGSRRARRWCRAITADARQWNRDLDA